MSNACPLPLAAPGDIVTKLRFLFIAVISLFGIMHVGAAFALFQDVKERRRTLAALQRPESGFRKLPGGTWLWACEQSPLDAAVTVPEGSAITLATIFGLPFVRLRAAIGPELIPGGLGQALGRRDGLSLTGLVDAHEHHVAALAHLGQSMPCCAPTVPPRHVIPPILPDEEKGAIDGKKKRSGRLKRPKPVASPGDCKPNASGLSAPPALHAMGSSLGQSPSGEVQGEDRVKLLVGTALVLAFLENAKILSVMQLAEHVSAARNFFGDVRVPGIDHGFEGLRSLFVLMLSGGNLSGRDDWLEKARLWRFALSQRADGGWPESSPSLAFALQAREGAVPPRAKKPSKAFAILAALFTGGGESSDDELLEDAIDEDMTRKDDGADEATARDDGSGVPFVVDCPLTFSTRAVEQRLPPALRQLNTTWEWEQRAAREHELREAVRTELQVTDAARLMLARALDDNKAVEAAMSLQRAAMLHTNTTAFIQHAIHAAAEALQHAANVLSGRAAEQPVQTHLYRQRPNALEESVERHAARLHVLSRELSRVLESPPLPPPPPPPRRGHRRRHLRPRVPVERVWSTLLALSALADSEVCLLVEEPGDGDLFCSLADAGHAFLETQAAADPRLRKLLASGALQAAALKARRDWDRIQVASVENLRNMQEVNHFNLLKNVQRASARVVRSLMVDNSTFAAFLDTSGYMMRWQRFMIIVTLVLSTLLTSIWFYCESACAASYQVQSLTRLHPTRADSRGASCILEIRALIDAGAGRMLVNNACGDPPALDPSSSGGCPPVGPCLGWVGDGADLQTQFTDVQGCFVYGDPGSESAHATLADFGACRSPPLTWKTCVADGGPSLRSVSRLSGRCLPDRPAVCWLDFGGGCVRLQSASCFVAC